MPTTETFTHLFTLTGTPQTGFTSNGQPGPRTAVVSDTGDGNTDGSTAVGQNLFLTQDGQTSLYTLVGFSSSGQPVLLRVGSTQNIHILLSNGPIAQGTDIGFTTSGTYTYCFAPGTGIATPAGEIAVEALSMGDPILTADGRTIPVRWIGRQTVSTMFAGERARPVLIRAGALGDGLPQADLTVTADHGVILDGLVINAGALVNGTTIRLVPLAELPATVTYYHVETADHDVILANGAPAETFVDYASRAAFDNHAEYLALYGAEPMLTELALPRISAARHLPPALRARLGLVTAA